MNTAFTWRFNTGLQETILKTFQNEVTVGSHM